VYKVACNITCENSTIVFLWKAISRIDGAAAGARKVILGIFRPIQIMFLKLLIASFGTLGAPIRRWCFLIHFQMMIRNIDNGIMERKIRMPVPISPRNDGVLNMKGILREESITPVIQGLTKLTGSGSSLELIPIHPEAKVRSAHR